MSQEKKKRSLCLVDLCKNEGIHLFPSVSQELNELRRPVSDNPEIMRFFKYMKAARRGQEASDCMYSYPTCTEAAPKTHTMVAAYHDINKLVTARKLNH